MSSKKLKNYVVLLFSIFFYAWGGPKFIFILLASVYVNFLIVKKLDASEKRATRRLMVGLSVAINIGLLGYFKYANFFMENFNSVLHHFGFQAVEWTRVLLPIGISFYTFQTLTYSIDVYRNVHKPLKKVTDYALYIIMFPQLIAGPIVRYNFIADQIIDRKASYNDRLVGFYRFTIGLAKKVVIANSMGAKADAILSLNFADISSTTAWIGILAYTFQIYFDFSGYSDMAIGIGKMIGFKFPENFNNPYVSKSITEFWRRWHMTLGDWMKNYLYIPLGGNRVKTARRLYFNLWFVFLLSGLWHGAAWNFIIWGAFHGTFLILERLFLSKLLQKAGNAVSIVYTFFVTIMGWVIFRIENWRSALVFYKKLFSFNFEPLHWVDNESFFAIFILAVIFSFFVLLPYGQKIQDSIFYGNYPKKKLVSMFFVSLLLFVISISYITTTGFNPFIYFRF